MTDKEYTEVEKTRRELALFTVAVERTIAELYKEVALLKEQGDDEQH